MPASIASSRASITQPSAAALRYAQAGDRDHRGWLSHTPAELLQQRRAATPVSRLPAQRIRYNLRTGDPEVDKAQMLEVRHFPGGNRKE